MHRMAGRVLDWVAFAVLGLFGVPQDENSPGPFLYAVHTDRITRLPLD